MAIQMLNGCYSGPDWHTALCLLMLMVWCWMHMFNEWWLNEKLCLLLLRPPSSLCAGSFGPPLYFILNNVYVHMSGMCALRGNGMCTWVEEPTEARRGYLIPWSWSYKQCYGLPNVDDEKRLWVLSKAVFARKHRAFSSSKSSSCFEVYEWKGTRIQQTCQHICWADA